MILNWKNPFGLHGLSKSISALYGLNGMAIDSVH